MWEDFKWGEAKYDIIYKDGKIEHIRSACFAKLSRGSGKDIERFKLYDYKCKLSIDYRQWYFEYVSEMLKLEEVEITEDYVTFKAYKSNVKNMLILSLFRLLYEQIGCIYPSEPTHTLFLEPLKNNECEYEDKLARFCYFYRNINLKSQYFSSGHSWEPKDTVIKYTTDFLNHKKFTGVNDFFTYETT